MLLEKVVARAMDEVGPTGIDRPRAISVPHFLCKISRN
jgi:hypothetical protein